MKTLLNHLLYAFSQYKLTVRNFQNQQISETTLFTQTVKKEQRSEFYVLLSLQMPARLFCCFLSFFDEVNFKLKEKFNFVHGKNMYSTHQYMNLRCLVVIKHTAQGCKQIKPPYWLIHGSTCGRQCWGGINHTRRMKRIATWFFSHQFSVEEMN